MFLGPWRERPPKLEPLNKLQETRAENMTSSARRPAGIKPQSGYLQGSRYDSSGKGLPDSSSPFPLLHTLHFLSRPNGSDAETFTKRLMAALFQRLRIGTCTRAVGPDFVKDLRAEQVLWALQWVE
ncbi:hypothetical protein F2P81_020529 [Scophthalmus maximus]|uniref:Uncharacterized protein n=1 Tax=Scophthalmus maximus TaxID=52904 RepID=A0A6A4S6G7_SCOMX|nr:hypothetical protein F2P81_020529 [Scophthalmus maximus]